MLTSSLVLLGEALLVGLTITLLYGLRRGVGLTPLFFFLGALEVGMYVYTGKGTVDFLFGVRVIPASFVFFSGLLYAILLLYILEGTKVTRQLIVCLIGLNVVYVLFDCVHTYQMLAPFGHPAGPAEALPQYAPVRMVLASSCAIVIDFFLLLVVYQFIVNHLRFIPEPLRILLAFVVTALADVLLFNTGAFYGHPDYRAILSGQAVSKPWAAAVFSGLLWVTVVALRRRGGQNLPALERAVLGVFAFGGRLEETTRRLRESEEEKRQLEDANLRLRAVDRMKTQFLANMSHELRSPLNDVLGFTDVLLQELPGPLTDDQRKQLQIVSTSARHLLELINDLLD